MHTQQRAARLRRGRTAQANRPWAKNENVLTRENWITPTPIVFANRLAMLGRNKRGTHAATELNRARRHPQSQRWSEATVGATCTYSDRGRTTTRATSADGAFSDSRTFFRLAERTRVRHVPVSHRYHSSCLRLPTKQWEGGRRHTTFPPAAPTSSFRDFLASLEDNARLTPSPIGSVAILTKPRS